MGGVLSSSGSSEKTLKLEEFNNYRVNHRSVIVILHNMILRWPYVFEDTLGVNMNYYTAMNMPANNLLTSEERRLVKANEIDDLKSIVFRELIAIDDPIDIYSKHTILHDAVMMNREEIFYFVL